MPLPVRGCAVCKWAFSSLQLALRAYHGLKSTCKASSLWKATRTVLYIGQWLRNSKASLTKAKALFNMPPVQQLTSAGQSPPGLLKPTLQCTPGHDFHQIAPTNSTRSRPSTAPYPADFLSSGWLPLLWSQLSKPPSAVATQPIHASGCRDTALLWEPLIPLCCVPQPSRLLSNTLSSSVLSPQTLTWSSRFPVNAGMACSFPFLFKIRSHTVVF